MQKLSPFFPNLDKFENSNFALIMDKMFSVHAVIFKLFLLYKLRCCQNAKYIAEDTDFCLVSKAP